MGDCLQHRGPDDAGEWIEPGLGMALAFRRLAIVDLSDLGHQPMLSACGRFVLAINGEVYNHQTLREGLEKQGHRFRGHSDTEVLLAGISVWGLEEALRRSVGMFAIALVDLHERRLHLARDRLGEKPLYYGWSKGHFFFGSELKAFRPHPNFSPEVDRRALTLYLRFGYVHSPYSILEGFYKLRPGHILSLALDGDATSGKETVRAYWQLPKPEEKVSFTGSAEDCLCELEALLGKSVQMQMLADVPVGAYLSGGVDSSTVVSLMQHQARLPVRTFTIGFPDARYDESSHAERIAQHLGTDHITWACGDSELLDLVRQIPHVYCEPFADDSQLPTLALARLARQHVTVCLSGDGGDELFHGYGRYAKSLRRWQQTRQFPAIRTGFGCGINTLSTLLSWLPSISFQRRWVSRLSKARNQWLSQNLAALYRHRMSRYKMPDLYLSQPETAREFFDDVGQMTALTDDVSWLSYLDLHTYLPDDLLVKVDRAAMAFGLETRMPLLDHRVVEFAARLPAALKGLGGRSKWPLRAILERRVPRALTERKKMGFSTPMNRWLRGPLREWAEDLLAENRLSQEGFFRDEEVRHLWEEHQQGRRNRALMLWTILMFQAWYESFWKAGSGLQLQATETAGRLAHSFHRRSGGALEASSFP